MTKIIISRDRMGKAGTKGTMKINCALYHKRFLKTLPLFPPYTPCRGSPAYSATRVFSPARCIFTNSNFPFYNNDLLIAGVSRPIFWVPKNKKRNKYTADCITDADTDKRRQDRADLICDALISIYIFHNPLAIPQISCPAFKVCAHSCVILVARIHMRTNNCPLLITEHPIIPIHPWEAY